MTRRRRRRAGLHIVGEVALGFPPPPRQLRARRLRQHAARRRRRRAGSTVRPDGTRHRLRGQGRVRPGHPHRPRDRGRRRAARAARDVEVVLGDTDLVPWDMGTFGSQSTARVGLQLRKAAATAREALLELAADRLDLPVERPRAPRRRASPRRSDAGRGVTYADLLARSRRSSRDIDDDDRAHAAVGVHA